MPPSGPAAHGLAAYGLPLMARRPWPADQGPPTMACRSWPAAHGLPLMARRSWPAAHGPLLMACRSWPAAYGLAAYGLQGPTLLDLEAARLPRRIAMNITHLTDQGTIETVIEGERAYVTYELYDGCLDVRKTLVPPPLAGQGLAGKLVKFAYDYAKEQGLKCIATCSYAVKWLERHPEYNGAASSDYVEGSCAVGKHQA